MLLPFQMSILHYTAPSVSATNQLFNIIAIPSGVWRYIKEGRMLWPLAWTVVIGTLPGVFIGAWIRLEYLPDSKNFKFFAGLVLLYLGGKLLKDVLRPKPNLPKSTLTTEKDTHYRVTDIHISLREIAFEFGTQQYAFSVPAVALLSFIVGIIGGIYGIGGGAMIAPFFVTFLHLPIYAIAGATLLGTFITSIAGVAIYQFLAPCYSGLSVAPDWYLGFLFGIGGFFGMYLGARCQKYVPVRVIKCVLCICVLFVAGKYLYDFLR